MTTSHPLRRNGLPKMYKVDLKKGMSMIVRAIFFLFCLVQTAFAATDYELPQDHPLYSTLERLFEDPSILESRESFADAGFMLYSHNHRGIVIAQHQDLPGHLIKVFINDVPHELQLRNLVS